MPRLTGWVAALIVGLVLAACSSTDGTASSADATPAEASPGATSPAATSPAAPTSTPASPEDALLSAARANDVEAARALIAGGADVNHQDPSRQSAFLIAASEVGDDPRLLDLTLAGGADVRATDGYDGTALIRAAERGFPAIVGRLIEAGVEIDHVNRLGWTALHEAIILGDGSEPYVRVVQQLVDAGADATLASRTDGVTPIEHARSRGFTEIADILRREINAMAPDERLLQASRDGSVVAVESALGAGADIEARDGHGRTALLRAVTEDHVDVARLLVSRGADVNAVDDQRDTPFLVTGVTGSVDMLDALLPGGPDTRVTNRYGGVAVIPAAERGHADYVRAVLERTDIDVNHVNDLGWTALLEAVILGDGGRRHQDVVRILLEHGADPGIADNDAVTAREHAERRGFTEIATLLAR